jgi:cyclase
LRRIRIIPVLLLSKGGLVKSVRFKKPQYVGDPINAVKIFNEKEVDEIVVLDIDATAEKRPPDFQQLEGIASEAFIPMAYGGGLHSIDHVRRAFDTGIEKVILNTAALQNPSIIKEASDIFGSQSIVVSIDVRKGLFGKYRVFGHKGKKNTGRNPVQFAKQMENAGAGEILLTCIDREGTFSGYDLELIHSVSEGVNIPVVACGGASKPEDFLAAVQEGKASAAAAGSFFVFRQPHRAVLISYPSQEELKEKVFLKL